MIFYYCTVGGLEDWCEEDEAVEKYGMDYDDYTWAYSDWQSRLRLTIDNMNRNLPEENAIIPVDNKRYEPQKNFYVVIDGKNGSKSIDDIISEMIKSVSERTLKIHPKFYISKKEITAGEFLENTVKSLPRKSSLPVGLSRLESCYYNKDWLDHEYMQNESINKYEADSICRDNHLGKDMEEEVKRILLSRRDILTMSGKWEYLELEDKIKLGREKLPKPNKGVPVQYLLVSDLPENRAMMKNLLRGVLKEANRTEGSLVYDETIRVFKEKKHPMIAVKDICSVYPIYRGETIAVSLEGCVDRRQSRKKNVYADVQFYGDESDSLEDGLRQLLTCMEEYRHDVQTIICTDTAGLSNILAVAKDMVLNTKLIVIKDDKCTKKGVSEWLFDKLNAWNNNQKTDKENEHKTVSKAQVTKLTNKIFRENDEVTWDKVAAAMEAWKNDHIFDCEKYVIYKNKYKSFMKFAQEEKMVKSIENATKADSDDAYNELENMIGLNSVKKTVKQVIDIVELNRLCESFDLDSMVDMPTMHMAFKGNPGTCKTTIARIIGRIMKEKGILSRGDFYEVGRNDLVAEYVGQTAIKVKEAFDKADGSILFIDEAYSLVEDRKGLFGEEAINTIIQEMENRRKDMVVIFAGYPAKMDRFLNVNPGMKSRIAHHIDFPDYNENELVQIFEKMVSDNGMKYSEETLDKVRNIIKLSSDEERNSNGRYIRNLFEKFKMKHAERIVKMDKSKLNKEILRTLTLDDCSNEVVQSGASKTRHIGFTA